VKVFTHTHKEAQAHFLLEEKVGRLCVNLVKLLYNFGRFGLEEEAFCPGTSPSPSPSPSPSSLAVK